MIGLMWCQIHLKVRYLFRRRVVVSRSWYCVVVVVVVVVVLQPNQLFWENVGSWGLHRISMGSLGFFIRIPYLGSLFGFLIWVPYSGSLYKFLIRLPYSGFLFGFLIWVPYSSTLFGFLTFQRELTFWREENQLLKGINFWWEITLKGNYFEGN